MEKATAISFFFQGKEICDYLDKVVYAVKSLALNWLFQEALPSVLCLCNYTAMTVSHLVAYCRNKTCAGNQTSQEQT